MKLFFEILGARMKLDLTPRDMREKEQLLERQSEKVVVLSPEESRDQELRSQMSEEAYKYYILGQVRAYMDMVREDVNRVSEIITEWREEIRESSNNGSDNDAN